MRIEVDEQTAGITIAAVVLGWMVYNADPQTKELAAYIGGAVAVVWMAMMIVTFGAMLTEMMLWDYLWQRTRGKNGSAE